MCRIVMRHASWWLDRGERRRTESRSRYTFLIVKKYLKSFLKYILIVAVIMAITGSVEYALGRKPWGVSGTPGLWSGDIYSSHNSQFVSDPYSLTHIEHGVLLYGFMSIVAKSLPIGPRLVLTVIGESGWEILENSDLVINRYREETISLDYFGDSIVNSLCDILFCIIGFFLASRLPKYMTILLLVVIEVILLFWIRDNLFLNIIMLIYPLEKIKVWQLGSRP